MMCIDLHNMHDCMMSRKETARRLWCRFPYNQTVKIKHLELLQAEWSHSCETAAGLIVMVIYWRHSSSCCAQNIWCTHSPGIHSGWSAARTEHSVCFYYSFLHIVYKNNDKVEQRMCTECWAGRYQGVRSHNLCPFLCPQSCTGPDTTAAARPLGARSSCRALTSITETGLWLHSRPAVHVPQAYSQDNTLNNMQTLLQVIPTPAPRS